LYKQTQGLQYPQGQYFHQGQDFPQGQYFHQGQDFHQSQYDSQGEQYPQHSNNRRRRLGISTRDNKKSTSLSPHANPFSLSKTPLSNSSNSRSRSRTPLSISSPLSLRSLTPSNNSNSSYKIYSEYLDINYSDHSPIFYNIPKLLTWNICQFKAQFGDSKFKVTETDIDYKTRLEMIGTAIIEINTKSPFEFAFVQELPKVSETQQDDKTKYDNIKILSETLSK